MTDPTIALALTEGRRMVRNPVIWLSLLPSAWWVRDAVRSGDAEDRMFVLVGYGLGWFGFVVVIVVVLAVLRGRIERADELLGTLAVGPDRRSRGHAVSALAPAAIATLATIAILLAIRPAETLGTWDPADTGRPLSVPRPNLAQLLQGPLAIVAMTAFAVALVRWVPTWLVVVPMLFAFGLQMLIWGIFHATDTHATDWLLPLRAGVVNGPWSGCGPDDHSCTLEVTGFDRVTPWWHAAYLIALACWLTTVAVLRHRRDGTAWTWFGGALTALVVISTIQLAVAQEYVA